MARCSPDQRSRLACVSTHCTTRSWLDRLLGLRPRRFQSLHWQGTHFPCSRGRDHGGKRKSLLRHHLRIVRSCLITHREFLISAHAPEISQLEVLWVFFSALFLTALICYATPSLPVPSNYALDVAAFQCLSTSPSPCSMASLLPSSRRLRVMTLAHLFQSLFEFYSQCGEAQVRSRLHAPVCSRGLCSVFLTVCGRDIVSAVGTLFCVFRDLHAIWDFERGKFVLQRRLAVESRLRRSRANRSQCGCTRNPQNGPNWRGNRRRWRQSSKSWLIWLGLLRSQR